MNSDTSKEEVLSHVRPVSEQDRSRKYNCSSVMKRVLLFDCLEDSLEVKSQRTVAKEKHAGTPMQVCFLPPHTKEIGLFVDAKTQTRVTTESALGGQSTVLLTKIYLDRLGPVNNLVRSFGGLQSIYIRNVDFLSEEYSLNPQPSEPP